MNNSHDCRAVEREYITSRISLRELCRRHGITAHSLVTVQAKKGKWEDKREAYQQQAGQAFIERHSSRMADRQAEISGKLLDAIDEAITKSRNDMPATEKQLVNGEWVEVPAWYMTPRELCLLIDRFEVLFGRPSVISQRQDLTASWSCRSMPCASSSSRREEWEGYPRRRSRRCRDHGGWIE